MESLLCWQGLVHLGRSGHDRSQNFGSISHISGPKLNFWSNFQMILYGFAWRNSKTLFWYQKALYSIKKLSQRNPNYAVLRMVVYLLGFGPFFNWISRFLIKKQCFLAPPRKTMQNHLGITWETSFGPEAFEIGPKLWLRSCPDLLLTA